MREWSDEVRSGMTRSSSARLAGRDSPRDERGRDVKLGGILSLWSLKLVTGARCATPRCNRRVSTLSPCFNRRLRMCSVRWHDRRPGVQGFSWRDGGKRETESSKQTGQCWKECRAGGKRENGARTKKQRADQSIDSRKTVHNRVDSVTH